MNFEVRYLAFDLESGGIPDGCSVLTAFFKVMDSRFKTMGECHLLVKPNDGLYTCTAEALGVNGINLIEHDKVAIPYSQAGQELRKFLVEWSQNGNIKLIPMGKNINGDIKWVNDQLLGAKTWNQFVSYRIWEVTTLALLAQHLGKYPQDRSISLGALVQFFDIRIEGMLHNEAYDTHATVLVNEELIRLIAYE